MTTITLDNIQKDFLTYLMRVRAGESVLIVDANIPVAELRPVDFTADRPRPFGLCAGEFVAPMDFDAPLPEAVLREFEGA